MRRPVAFGGQYDCVAPVPLRGQKIGGEWSVESFEKDREFAALTTTTRSIRGKGERIEV